MERVFLFIAGLFGMTAIALGAYASHGLTHVLAPDRIEIVKLGVQYQLFHALALVGVSALSYRIRSRLLDVAGWAFIIGIVLFCGTLYASTLLEMPRTKLTPLGGLALMIGWLSLCVTALRKYP